MIFIFTLSGDADNIDDIQIPMSSFSSRQKNGSLSSLEIVVPGLEQIDAFEARANGELVVSWEIGDTSGELIRANFNGFTPSYGVSSQSVQVSGSKTETFDVPDDPLDISEIGVNSRSPNKTDGAWTYQGPDVAGLILSGARAGYTLLYSGHQFTAESIQYQISVSSQIFYISE